MNDKNFIYLPLGGAGEIGMNCYIYGFGPKGKESLIIVDFGVSFPDAESTPGVDLILPDISWLLERRDRIKGIFLTHAHEDHIGAIGLFPEFSDIPIYARPFTAANAQRKLSERGKNEEVVKEVSIYPKCVELDSFSVSFLPVSHSIPESSGLIIETELGKVFHTGDFKLDRTPILGDPFEPSLWKAACVDLDVLVCDSTNVLVTHPAKSEKSLKKDLVNLIKSQSGMVIATTFASNIARLKTLADAAVAADRSIVLLGRAMRRMIELGLQTGILKNFPNVVSPEQALELPRSHIFILSTGSQGERRAASAQLSNGKYRGMVLKEGDTFLFSSKTIPGNEVGVNRIINNLSKKNVNVVENEGDLYHVSGHANRSEISDIHKLLKPSVVIPMHGEFRHLRSHYLLAKANGFQSIIAGNGSLVDISNGQANPLKEVESGKTYLDGKILVGSKDGVVRDRVRMSFSGHISINIIIDENDELIDDVWVHSHGLPKLVTGKILDKAIEDAILGSLSLMDDQTLMDDQELRKIIIKSSRNIVMELIDKKPEITVLINRLMAV
jgi:ribonuclease J